MIEKPIIRESEIDIVKSGDLLIWSRDERSFVSNFFLNGIRALTRSEYAHTAPAWRMEGKLFVVEPTIPIVRISHVKPGQTIYHIPVADHIDFNEKSEEWLLDKDGKTYSLIDCVNAYIGVTLNSDDRWQCAELCKEFYLLHGIDLGDAYTPARVVRRLLEKIDGRLNIIRT